MWRKLCCNITLGEDRRFLCDSPWIMSNELNRFLFNIAYNLMLLVWFHLLLIGEICVGICREAHFAVRGSIVQDDLFDVVVRSFVTCFYLHISIIHKSIVWYTRACLYVCTCDIVHIWRNIHDNLITSIYRVGSRNRRCSRLRLISRGVRSIIAEDLYGTV